MLIPKNFKIGDKRYSVFQYDGDGGTMGCSMPEIQCIRVRVKKRGQQVPKRVSSETFWHEVTHAILHDMSHPLWRNEKFVTEFSKRLNEVVYTAKL